ncbi:MAG: hypothetical protein CSA81_12920 [Acidobacteria bacterium]|nr:MAG: hypothetical protein CSA81_12920 [Acidobacteriota bacterium]PIE89121.1 MAG: hypothetical protein CR997_12660 [Acidobacteriota bacterium]
MKSFLAETETTVPGRDNKPTQRPTLYMLTIKFKGILLAIFLKKETRLTNMSLIKNTHLIKLFSIYMVNRVCSTNGSDCGSLRSHNRTP